MRILFVAMSNSIHTARWISQISDQGWDIHLFPSYDVGAPHPELKNVTIHHSTPRHSFLSRKIFAKAIRYERVAQLANLINDIKPDIVHSLEFQGAAYLTLDAKKRYGGAFPPWIVTSWGSDIYFFGRFPDHKAKITSIFAECDYYLSESKRDVALAKQFGFKHTILPILPPAGGFDMNQINNLRSNQPTSSKKIIMLKGYHGWAGRALVGLEALKQCRDVLHGYEIMMYSTQLRTRIAAKRFGRLTGIPITIVPHGTAHTKILKLHSKARIAMGLSITDGVPYGMLEAMAMGSFPIQSFTSCADEWLVDGKSGLFVPSEDPTQIAKALRRALTDNQLVDHAAILNIETVRERLDQSKITPRVITVYKSILKA